MSIMAGLEFSTIGARSTGAFNCPTLASHVDNSSRNGRRMVGQAFLNTGI
jgi:hypothetical protein